MELQPLADLVDLGESLEDNPSQLGGVDVSNKDLDEDIIIGDVFFRVEGVNEQIEQVQKRIEGESGNHWVRVIHNGNQTRENRLQSVNITWLAGDHHDQLDPYQFGGTVFAPSDAGEDDFDGHDVLVVVGAVIVQSILSQVLWLFTILQHILKSVVFFFISGYLGPFVFLLDEGN